MFMALEVIKCEHKVGAWRRLVESNRSPEEVKAMHFEPNPEVFDAFLAARQGKFSLCCRSNGLAAHSRISAAVQFTPEHSPDPPRRAVDCREQVGVAFLDR